MDGRGTRSCPARYRTIYFAVYDTNLSEIVDGLYTYPSGVVLIHLTNQPGSHPACNASYFAMDPASMDAGAMSRMYARLLISYSLHEPIHIGYDSWGDCAVGYIHVWPDRIGVSTLIDTLPRMRDFTLKLRRTETNNRQ